MSDARARLRAGAGGRRSQAGSAAVELVLLAPLLVVFFVFIAGLGRVVETKGQVYGAARDAARAASLQREPGGALAAADVAARADLGSRCGGGLSVGWGRGSSYLPGRLLVVEVRCTVLLGGFGIAGFAPSQTVGAQSAAPLDTYRRVR